MSAVDTRDQFFDVWDVYWPIAVAVFVIILALVVGLIVRYRSDSRGFPRGRDESTPIEAGYAALLACIAAFLIAITYSQMPGGEGAASTVRPVQVEVTAARWNWRFEYPRYGAVEQGTKSHVPVLRLPAGAPIDFSGSSIDVIHSFWIPEERFKRDVFPAGRLTHWEMTFEEPGFWPAGGECAEFCGLEHSNMSFDIVVMARREFESWARGAGGAG